MPSMLGRRFSTEVGVKALVFGQNVGRGLEHAQRIPGELGVEAGVGKEVPLGVHLTKQRKRFAALGKRANFGERIGVMLVNLFA